MMVLKLTKGFKMKTSDGLMALLERKGLIPTGDRVKDLELAKSVMPTPFNSKLQRNEQNKIDRC